MKDKVINFRISDTLLERYEKALEKEGLTRTVHLTSAIHQFVEKSESKEASAMELEKAFDGTLESAERFVEWKQYPPIGRSLFWFGYFAKSVERLIGLKEDDRSRFFRQIHDMRLFSLQEMMRIHGLALEKLTSAGKALDDDLERIQTLAYQDFSESAKVDLGLMFYWMAGYTFLPGNE